MLKHWLRRSTGPVLVLAAIALTLGGPTAQAVPSDGEDADGSQVEHQSCSTPVPGGVRCLSTWRPMPAGSVSQAAVAPPAVGYGPADMRRAYQLPATGGGDQTIAIVDAFDNPHVEADLAVYREAWGLPPCTTANGCFRKVDQRGGTKYPIGDAGWGVEIALDVQAVSATCSSCRILLVVTDDQNFENMGTGVATAVRLGADVVSNSYGADEFAGMMELAAKYYTHPGVPILASTGDFGFRAASYPAVLASTWAIGGTRLTTAANGNFVEQAWSGAGSGCSAIVAKPAAQKDKNCAMRTVADISATADSDEGFAVYNTYEMKDAAGWISVGGTSLAAPLIAGMIGLAGRAPQVADPAHLYANPQGLHDVVGGVNGFCGGDYLCTGLPGYDAPTGLGSPRGLASL